MATKSPKVFVIDDDAAVRRALLRLLQTAGYDAQGYESPASFLSEVEAHTPGCLLLDMAMPGLSGLDVQRALIGSTADRPIIFLSGQCDMESTICAMRAGAVDFLTKPVSAPRLLAAVASAVRLDCETRGEREIRSQIRDRIDSLTRREAEVFAHVIRGRLNKQIAADLGTVEKTVKVHRARVMQKMRVRTLAELVQLALTAGVATKPTQLMSRRWDPQEEDVAFTAFQRAGRGGVALESIKIHERPGLPR